MPTTKIDATGVTFPDTSVQASAAAAVTKAEVASNNLRNSNNTEKYIDPTQTYTKKKEVKLNANLAACRIKFDLRAELAAGGYGCIRKNGEAIGTEQYDDTTVYQTFSQDFTGFAVNDLIQIYLKNATAGGYSTYVKNMQFYYDGRITALGSNVLATPLLLSSPDPTISMTNQDP